MGFQGETHEDREATAKYAKTICSTFAFIRIVDFYKNVISPEVKTDVHHAFFQYYTNVNYLFKHWCIHGGDRIVEILRFLSMMIRVYARKIRNYTPRQ